MAARDEVRAFRRRSKTFLRHARESLSRKEYDFAAFAAEQAAQLALKAELLNALGEVPRTHGVRELLGILADSVPHAAKEARDFTRANRAGLKILDDAYVSARYLFSDYTKEDAKMLVDLSAAVSRLLKGVEHGRRGDD